MREQKKFWMIGISILIVITLSGNASASLGSQGFPTPDFEREEYMDVELHVMNSLEATLEKNPESAFYGLSVALERMRIALTINSERRAELKERFAWERLREAHHLMKQNNTGLAESIMKDNEREIKGLMETTGIPEKSMRERLGKPLETPVPPRKMTDNRTILPEPDRREERKPATPVRNENRTVPYPLDVAKNATERVKNDILRDNNKRVVHDEEEIITSPEKDTETQDITGIKEESIVNNVKDTLPSTDEKNII